METFDIETWVERADNSAVRELRGAIHTVLYAISQSKPLSDNMIIKGGVLLAIRFRSHRFTKDIDFSTPDKYADFDQDKFIEELSEALTLATASLPYGLDCRIQSVELSPRKGTTFPTLKINIGYAYKGSAKHRLLLAGRGPDVLQIDYSFNEKNLEIDFVEIEEDATIKAYSLVDIVGEKYRAIIQQKVRNRIRRQDAYDIFWLIRNDFLSTVDKEQILTSLVVKSRSRGIDVTKEDLNDPEVRTRSQAEYATLQQEIEGELPPFDLVYEEISGFYSSLPWEMLAQIE